MNPDTEEHKRCVKIVLSSWSLAIKAVPQWHELFFTELSHREPKVFGLYSFDIAEMSKNSTYRRHAKLLQGAMEKALFQLEDSYESSIPTLVSLGERHYTYGVEPSHLLLLVDVLMWLLSAAFNAKWTADREKCWRYCLGLVVAPIIAGLKSAQEKTANTNKLAESAVLPKKSPLLPRKAVDPARDVETISLKINGNVCHVSVV